MIPFKLQIKNFVSYGDVQEIDFEPYHLICLSGKNGHGKSALLDALTWVVWGHARKVGGQAKADEGLLRLGQNHMMVSLDFSCNNTLYRVRREYTVSANKAYSVLEFGIVDPQTKTLKPLTDKTIRATQAKIEAMIGLDYDSFINSAFLKQGHSDEFSKKTPKERKEILASILGLGHFEELRKCALDIAKDASQQKEQTVSFLERLKKELEELPLTSQKLTVTDVSLATLAKKEDELSHKLDDLRKKQQSIQAQRSLIEKSLFQKEQLEKRLSEQKQMLLHEVARWRSIARQQRKLSHLPHLEEMRTHLQTEITSLQVLGAKKIQLKDEWLSKKEAFHKLVQHTQEQYMQALEKIKLQEQRITLELTQTREKQLECEKRLSLIIKEHTILEAEIKKCTTEVIPDITITNLEKEIEYKKGAYHTFCAQMQRITSEKAELEQKMQLLKSSEEAQCPLCEQKTEREALESKFMRHQRLCDHQAHRLTNVIKSLKTTLIHQHDTLQVLKKKSEQSKLIQVKKEELEKQIHKLNEEKKAKEQELIRCTATVEATIKTKDMITQELIALQIKFQQSKEDELFKKKEQELAFMKDTFEKIAYDPEAEKVLHKKLEVVTQQTTQQAAFLKESTLQEERKRSINQQCTHAIELKKQISFLATTLGDLRPFHEAEAQTVAEEKELLAVRETLAKEKELLIHQKGALESQSSVLKQREIEYKTHEKTRESLEKTGEEYTTLATAFSKDGIQALLIEDALPEIEQEANNLLSRLTENQAHLSIESLRDLRSGKTKETLDIKISDAMGVRPYELFSGGEAFRIDFSLRIAISKLLARRAGTALQTLIIDEGFGSQDEEGLTAIMDSLYKIQDDFAKIIIVSHLSNMKEQFPVHFQVTKTAQGSEVTVREHC